MNCPKCNQDLKEVKIGYAEKGEMIYNIYLDTRGNLEWEQDEMIDTGEGYFFCKECGTPLEIDEEKLIEILKEE